MAGTVTYAKRDCYIGPAGHVPLAGALITISTAGHSASALLDEGGRFRVSISGRGTIRGFITLDGPLISVGPDRPGSKPYAIAIEELDPRGSYRANRIFLEGADAGAASIWMLLNKAASVAKDVAPVPIRHVRALWRYGADLETWLADYEPSDYGQAIIHVGGNRDGSQRDEFEAFPLLHEYAHYLLEAVADPGVQAVGEHDFRSVHPEKPALPWSEGFADAFAAIVLRNPRLTLGCKTAMDLAASPATPLPEEKRFAQYNETAVAGAVWGLVHYLGRTPRVGLQRFLKALKGYHRAGHPAQDLRDVRDSLVEGGLEGSTKRYEAFYEIFRRQAIGWGWSVHAQWDASPNRDYEPRSWVTVEGPYGCDGRGHPDGVSVPGGLPYTYYDECKSADDANFNVIAEVPFPYLTGGRHRSGKFTARLGYDCTDGERDKCPASVLYRIDVFNGLLAKRTSATVRRGQSVEIGFFYARGSCHFIGGLDCSV